MPDAEDAPHYQIRVYSIHMQLVITILGIVFVNYVCSGSKMYII